MTFKVSKGFNTYKVALDSLTQPPYVETRIKPKIYSRSLRRLTSASLATSVYRLAEQSS
jgi:hypothetical protein